MKRLLDALSDIWLVFTAEVRRVFGNPSVLLIFIGGSLIYPAIFCFVYLNEMVNMVPVAVVDESQSEASKRLVHKIDATPELVVDYQCATIEEAKKLLRDQRIHGFFFIPRDYGTRLAQMETAHVAVFCDMTPFLYYRCVMQGASNVLKDEMEHIEIGRYELSGMTEVEAAGSFAPVKYDDVKLYNPSGGFTSFLVPALLVLVLHQTLFLGIGIVCGTANEDERYRLKIPTALRRKSIYRVTLGQVLCYLLIYVPLSAIVLVLVPYIAHLPQIGAIHDVILMLLPFLLATICFSIAFGNFFIHERTNGILYFIFFSVILLFLSGIVWPQSNIPSFWSAVSYLFPSTPGMRGFVKITSMGATLSEARSEYLTLWIQTAVYFELACQSLVFNKKFHKR